MGAISEEGTTTDDEIAQLLLEWATAKGGFFTDEELDSLTAVLEGKPMSANAVKLIFARLAQKSGVKRLHVHLCRHTFAANYLLNGGNVFFCSRYLGIPVSRW